MEYRYDDQIGSTGGGQIHAPIDSLIGFDADKAAVITGIVSARVDTPTRISVPYPSPKVGHLGGDDLVRLAPIGVTDEEWGGLRPVRDLAAGYADGRSYFADVASGQGLQYLPLSTMRFSARDDVLEGRQITTAVPPVSQSDLWSGSRRRGA